jgi:hypothetical protein
MSGGRSVMAGRIGVPLGRQCYSFQESRHMKQAIWRRIGPLTGLLYFALTFIGLSIHGYPDIHPTDAQLSKWLASVDVNSFRTGVYLEALAGACFIPFAAWLYLHLRRGDRDSSWPPVAMFAAAVGATFLSLPINEIYAALVDRARSGVDIHVAQTIVSIAQEWFDMTGIVMGLFLVLAGVAMIRGGAMAAWVAWATILAGVAQLVTSPLGLAVTPAELLPYAWILAVAGYYTVRPGHEREVSPAGLQASVASSKPATG